jgi:predicted ArsR family transcriptional regulator
LTPSPGSSADAKAPSAATRKASQIRGRGTPSDVAPDRLSVPPDRLAAAGDPQLRRILLYTRRRRDPFTAAEAAADLAIHRNVARSRLDRLVEAGFLDVSLERRGPRRGPGAGRPAKVYRVAPEVEGVEFPDRRMGELIGLLVEKVPARTRSSALREVGQDFGRELATAAGLAPARSVRRGLERLCDALGSLGFQVSLVSLQGAEAELVSPTCPLRPLVVQYPETTGIDCGMWAGLVERGVPDVVADHVYCETPRCQSGDDSCQILLALDARASARPRGDERPGPAT